MTKDGFEIYPAIDVRHGQVVRLQEGDPARQTVFGDDPLAVAERWAAQGACWLHVVSLDGALDDANHAASRAAQFDALLQSLCSVGPRVQFGGGVRSLSRIEAVLRTGVSRVVLGTAAVEQPELVREAVDRFGSAAIAVGLDTRQGYVRVRGWQTEGGLTAVELGRQVKALGVEWLVHTEIERDGRLVGVNVQASARLAGACGLRVITSGGVAGADDVRQARAAGLAGVIIGRALYEGGIDLQALIKEVEAV